MLKPQEIWSAILSALKSDYLSFSSFLIFSNIYLTCTIFSSEALLRVLFNAIDLRCISKDLEIGKVQVFVPHICVPTNIQQSMTT